MSRLNHKQIKDTLVKELSPSEHLKAIGVFKKVPPTGMLILTRGMAWLFSEVLFVAVTNKRLILLPDPNQQGLEKAIQRTTDLGFNEVDFSEGSFQSIYLKIHQPDRDEVLKLRFKPGYDFLGRNKFDFIAAVQMGKDAFIAALP